MVGDWWLVAVGSGWRLAVGSRWRLAAVGGWRLVAVGGWLRVTGAIWPAARVPCLVRTSSFRPMWNGPLPMRDHGVVVCHMVRVALACVGHDS